jgi:hypothetical protein
MWNKTLISGNASKLAQRAGLLLLALLLSACSSLSASKEQQPLLQLTPASLGATLSLTQRLAVVRLHGVAERQQSLDVLLEVDTQRVHLAGFALGQRILTLSWDGETLQTERHPLLPAAIDGVHVLRDIQLIYWPADAIRAALPAGWYLVEQERRRELWHGQQIAVDIHYPATPRWHGRTLLQNQREGYQLTIDSQETAADPGL